MSEVLTFSAAPESANGLIPPVQEGPRRCLVAVCHNGPVVPTKTAVSLMELGWGARVGDAKAAHGFEAIDFYWAVNWPRVDVLRDSAVSLALRESYSHLLFLDADMVWPTDVLVRMLRHHALDVVSGLYVLKTAPYAPVALAHGHRPDGSKVTSFDHQTVYGDDLVEVDVVGMGCCLVQAQIFRDLGARPWFHYDDDDEGWPRITEDVPFCARARALGRHVWLDPTVKCGHVTTQVIDERWHKRYQASMDATAKRASFSAVVPSALEG